MSNERIDEVTDCWYCKHYEMQYKGKANVRSRLSGGDKVEKMFHVCMLKLNPYMPVQIYHTIATPVWTHAAKCSEFEYE